MKLNLFAIIMAFCMVIACEKKNEMNKMDGIKSTAVKEEHRCANCGMFTDKYPNWEQKVISEDKGTMYFDGTRCMFKILLDSMATPKNIQEILVKDYYSLEYIDGKSAFYVIGSDVLGPMGNELIPFKANQAAKEFLNDHKGEKIVLFDEVNMALIMKLIGKMRMK